MQPPSPISQTVDLPAGKRVSFSFVAPDLLGYEITPDFDFAERADAVEFLRAYVAARQRFIRLVAALTGMTIAVVDELGDGLEAISEAIAPEPREC